MSQHLIRRVLALLAAALLLIALAPSALADDINTTQSCSLTLKSELYGEALSGVSFTLYRVADVSGSLPDFTPVAPFSEYPISLDCRTMEEWNSVTATLRNFVNSKSVTPAASGKTDREGQLSFELPVGLYLVVGKELTVSGNSISPSAFMLCLPGRDDAGNWSYLVQSHPKFRLERRSAPATPPSTVISPETPPPDTETETETETLRVLKAWDDGNSESRPAFVTVSLYCDGTLYQTVMLEESKSWRYIFEDLPVGHEWSVMEAVPEGYTVRIQEEGNSILLTNTRNQVSAESHEIELIEPLLPQLGLLWWPVPALLALGLLLMLLAAVLRKRGRS